MSNINHTHVAVQISKEYYLELQSFCNQNPGSTIQSVVETAIERLLEDLQVETSPDYVPDKNGE